MTLHDILEALTYGELSQLAVGNLVPDDGESFPLPKDYNKLLSHVNLALTALYTRFWLSSKEVIVQQYDHIQQYYLDRDYAATNYLSTEDPKYIIDSVFDPFVADVLKIETIHDEGGRELFVNDLTESWSVFTPTYNSIQVPYPMWCNHILVTYRADHPRLRLDVMLNLDGEPVDDNGKRKKGWVPDLHRVKVSLPNGFLEPLLYYIASRAFAGLNTDANQEGNNYLQKYERSCKELEKQGLQLTTNFTNTKLDKAGWA